MPDYLLSPHARPLRPSFFFFFQAEDGIRDLTVTGVQTCALPIFFRHGRNVFGQSEVVTFEGESCRRATYATVADRADQLAAALARLGIQEGDRVGTRSEERRVGKEWRERASPDYAGQERRAHGYS